MEQGRDSKMLGDIWSPYMWIFICYDAVNEWHDKNVAMINEAIEALLFDTFGDKECQYLYGQTEISYDMSQVSTVDFSQGFRIFSVPPFT